MGRIHIKEEEVTFPEPRQGLRRATLIDVPQGFEVKAINLHQDELLPGGSSRQHRELHEHLMFILSGKGVSIIDGQEYQWEAGDALFIPSWAWHENHNPYSQPARFLVATVAPLMRNLGLLRREDAPSTKEAPSE
ncbi:MAG: cupin domain-containing protein [Chloroflexi bacterium]|nr:cupin domain-containing protein [Chloroflexota bacterium]